jgi:hypothetical protein
MKLKPRGLDPRANYVVTSHDGLAPQTLSGEALMSDGLSVTIPGKPGSALFTYKKAR